MIPHMLKAFMAAARSPYRRAIDHSRPFESWPEAEGNLSASIQRVDACAETRLRVITTDGVLNEAELKAARVEAVLKPPDRVVGLLVGLNADQYAARDARSARQALRRKPCSAIGAQSQRGFVCSSPWRGHSRPIIPDIGA
jgi:phosphotransferase system IIB component